MRAKAEHPGFDDPAAAEADLVRRMLAGEERAFEELADDYFPGLYRYVYARLGQQRELTREIVQSAVSKAVTKLSTYRGEAALFTWLCACCRTEIALHFRSKSRAPVQLPLPEEPELDTRALPGAPDGPERSLLRGEAASLVHRALDQLPPHYGRALEWKYLDGASVKEIADRLELGAKAAESLLTRARLAFRDAYRRLVEGPALRPVAAAEGQRGG